MRAIPIDQLRFFDGINWRTLRWILGAAFFMALSMIGPFASGDMQAYQIALFLAHLAVAASMVFVRNRPWMYGEERAAELLAAASGIGMRKLIDSLLGDVAAFTAGGIQNDDRTIVAARLR